MKNDELCGYVRFLCPQVSHAGDERRAGSKARSTDVISTSKFNFNFSRRFCHLTDFLFFHMRLRVASYRNGGRVESPGKMTQQRSEGSVT